MPILCSGGELDDGWWPADSETDGPTRPSGAKHYSATTSDSPRAQPATDGISGRSVYKWRVFCRRHDIDALCRGWIHQRLHDGLGSVAEHRAVTSHRRRFAGHVWTKHRTKRVPMGCSNPVLTFLAQARADSLTLRRFFSVFPDCAHLR
jgi:hypothetical protein